MIRREIITQIEDYLYDPEVIILYGARQVGKTSIMKYLQEKETRETLFLDLEDKDNFAVVNTTAEKFVEYLEAQRGWTGETPLVVFIDEFQYMDNPTSFLKYAHDHYPNLKLIVSGSSTLEIRKKLKDSMVGRYVKFNIYPLNFSEFLTFKGKENLSKILRKPVSLDIINEELLDFYNEYIIYGGYPRIVLESNYEKKKQLLNSIVETYLMKDVSDIGKILDIDKFNKLLVVLASQSGNLLNMTELSNDGVGIAWQTLSEWLLLLKDTFVVSEIRPFSGNIRSELVKMPKIFFEDTGIRNCILNSFEIDGAGLENAIYNDLYHSETFKKINFYRTKDKKEIDFILDGNPYEVKVAFNGKRLTALEYFKNKYNQEGKVITLKKPDSKKYQLYYPWEVGKE